MVDELLLFACSHDDIDEAASLLATGAAHVNCRSIVGTTPLHEACRSGASFDLIDLLLSYKADPNLAEISHCGGKTCLFLAVERNQNDYVLELLQNGARPSPVSTSGLTPLHTAAIKNCPESAQLLLAFSADPHLRDYDGHNAAYWAQEYKNDAMLEILTNVGASPRHMTAKDYVDHLALNNGQAGNGGKKKAKAGAKGKKKK